MSGRSDEPRFRFNDLPKEIRLLIWKEALPGPRIIHLQSYQLLSYYTTRVWSDKSIEEVNDEGVPTFFDAPWGGSGTEEEFFNAMFSFNMGENRPCGFRSQNPSHTVPNIACVCRESLEVVERFYTKAFGSWNAFPETWFDFEVDTLYLDWGWNSNGMQFSASDFAGEAPRVKHLALYQAKDDYHVTNPGDYEDFMCEIFVDFNNLKTLTLVNKRHKPNESDSLVFMEPVDLLIWQGYEKKTSPDIDLTRLDACIDDWLDSDTFDSPITMDWDELERFRKQWAENRIPPWKMPYINRRIITTDVMKGMLGEIAGGPSKVEKLSTLSRSWLRGMTLDSVGTMDSVDLTPTQQRMYLDLFIAAHLEYTIGSIEDWAS